MSGPKRKGETVLQCLKCSSADFHIVQTTNLLAKRTTDATVFLVRCSNCGESGLPGKWSRKAKP